MARQTTTDDANPLRPTTSAAQWEAQGWAATADDLAAAPRLAAAISIRLDPETAALVARAARLSGRTRSEFVRRATIAAAEVAVQEAERVPLQITHVSTDRQRATTGSALPVAHEPARSHQEHGEVVTAGPVIKSTVRVG